MIILMAMPEDKNEHVAIGQRMSRTHVYIVDGTLSRLDYGCQTHAGRLYHLLKNELSGTIRTVSYNAGVQGNGWQRWTRAALGIGVNDAILEGYSTLASRYRPGDRIFLLGYSRGAYAVRSLAGLICKVGLLRHDEATERRIQRAFRYYRGNRISKAADAFREAHCHPDTPIAFLGCWDTVKALGLPYPVLSRVFPMATEFHDHELGPSVEAAFHALALDEDRNAYAPILWEKAEDWHGTLEQAWFAGAHGDIGGERNCDDAPIPLNNLSFVWMLKNAAKCGLELPDEWQSEFMTDPSAPMVGCRSGINRLFVLRQPRTCTLGLHGQTLHTSVAARMGALPSYVPLALAPMTPDQARTSAITSNAS